MTFGTTERHKRRLASGGVSTGGQPEPGGRLAVGGTARGNHQHRREHERSASDHDTASFRSFRLLPSLYARARSVSSRGGGIGPVPRPRRAGRRHFKTRGKIGVPKLYGGRRLYERELA